MFFAVNIFKLIVFGLFLAINIEDQGSAGWAFQHAVFAMIVVFIFLPLSLYERSYLKGKVKPLYTYIPLFIALTNWAPVMMGNIATIVYIGTQAVGICLTVWLMMMARTSK